MQQYRKNLGKVSLTAEGVWNNSKQYKILSIVYDEHTQHGFISKKEVPSGVDLYNAEYWMPLNVSGFADNNIIILSKKISDTSIQSYTLEEAVKSIPSVGRKPGAILGFYNKNTDRLDIGGRWELWQFNSTTISEWEDLSNWQNIYYNYNKFVGWYRNEKQLKANNPFPEVGCYAYVGTELNEATVYRCDNKYVWTNTAQHSWDYIKVIVDGNVSIGENGNWFNDGVDTNIPASIKGENGKTPVFRNNNNVIEVSYNNVDWTPISDEITAWFRWKTAGGQQANSTGKIQISRDKVIWTDLSGEFVNNLRISRYIGANESLPTSGIAEGTIYAKGPTYADGDTSHSNPIYRLWVYAWKDNTLAWQDNGEFQSIAAGIVQETGDSETEVMSQKAVTEKLSEFGSKLNTDRRPLYDSPNLVTSGGVFSELYGNGEAVSDNISKGNTLLSIVDNAYISSFGEVTENDSYKIYYYISSHSDIYVSNETYAGRKNIVMAVYNNEILSSNLVALFEKGIDDIDLPGTLPTINNKYNIQSNCIVAISIHNNFDFEVIQDTIGRTKKVHEEISDLKKSSPIVEFESGYNKFNPANIVNSYINTSGVDDFSDNSLSTDFVEIPNNAPILYLNNFPTYTSDYSRVCAFYDIDKKFISRAGIGSGESSRDINIPTNAKYLRVSIFVLYGGDKTFNNIYIGFDANHKSNSYKEAVVSVNGIKFKLPTFDKTLVVFGDSRVETATMDDDGTNYIEGTKRNYPMYLPKMLQLGDMKNFALSGASYRFRGSHYKYRQEISNQILCAIANGVVPDIVIIDAGTNDANASLAAHSKMNYEDTMNLTFDDLSLSEWLNAVRWAFEKVKTTWKDAICFAITPTQRADMWTDDNVKNGLKPVVCKGIKEMAETFNFIIIDSFSESGICYINENWEASGHYLSDGLHPNENGMKRLADYVSSAILSRYNS